MAGIENLKNRILKDDEEKAKQIESEAKLKAEEILKQSREKSELFLREAKVKAEKEANDRKERIIARAELDARNNILGEKQNMIDKVLSLAGDKVNNMDSIEYSKFIGELLLTSIETGDEEVIFSEREKHRIDPGLISRINDKLALINKKGMLRLSSEVRNIGAGFILRNGGIEINSTIDSQIRMLRDSLEGDIANLIFDGR